MEARACFDANQRQIGKPWLRLISHQSWGEGMSFAASPASPRAAAYELITLRPAVAADVAALHALCEAMAPRELGWLAGGAMSAAEFALGVGDPDGISLVALLGE